MKPKTMILMVVAVACGLGASYMTSRLLAERGQPQSEETVMVLVAKQKVPAFEPIKDPEKYFEQKPFLASSVSKKAIKEFDQLRGQRLNKPMTEGNPVSEDDLLNLEQLGLIGKMTRGERAVSVKVNAESSTAGFVQPGNRVDVVCTMRGNDPNARLFLQDMLVLAVDDKIVKNPDQQSTLGQTVTLAAKPDEALKLALAAAQGELRLLPRTFNDKEPIRIRVVRMTDLDKLNRGEKEEAPETTDEGRGGAMPLPRSGLPPVVDVPSPKIEQAKKITRWKMTVRQGTKVEKHVFMKGPDEDEDGPTSSGGSDTPLAPPAPPTETPAPKKSEQPAPKPPASPFGGRRVPRGYN